MNVVKSGGAVICYLSLTMSFRVLFTELSTGTMLPSLLPNFSMASVGMLKPRLQHNVTKEINTYI
jgi:hypothetical protein